MHDVHEKQKARQRAGLSIIFNTDICQLRLLGQQLSQRRRRVADSIRSF